MIKKITNKDLEIVNELLQNIDRNEKVSIDMLEHPFFNYVGYTIDAKIVGIIKYSLIYDRIEIDYIYVIPEYRKNKIGTKLIEHVIDVSTRKKNIKILLEVRRGNVVARKLYESMGFKEIAIRRNYYGNEDAIVYMGGESDG